MPPRAPLVYVCGDAMLDATCRRPDYRLDQETGTVPVLPAAPPGAPDVTCAPGGAANVAANLAALGCRTVLFAPCADRGPAAAELARLLRAAGVTVHPHACGPHRDPAGVTVKTRYYRGPRLVARVDADCDTAPVFAPGPEVPAPDAVVLTDYGRGALTPGAAASWAARWPGVPVYADPKAGRLALWRGAAPFAFVCNRTEAAEVLDHPDPARTAAAVAAFTGAARVVVKLGHEGSIAYDPAQGPWDRAGAPNGGPGEYSPVRVPAIAPGAAPGALDVQGAGDTYLAGLVAAACRGAGFEAAAVFASAAAGVAVYKPGTAVATLAEAARAAAPHLCRPRGVIDYAGAVALAAELRACGVAVGYTNGCFDLRPTAGHRHVVREGALRCGFLFVGVDADARVRRLKGPTRPIVPGPERAAAVGALAGAGAAFEFDCAPAAVVSDLEPDVLFKGGSYTAAAMPEVPALLACGGTFVHVGAVPCTSTTQLLSTLSNPVRGA